MIVIGFFLSGCTDTSAVLTYDLDYNTLSFEIPSNKIAQNYENIITSNFITVTKTEQTHKVRVSFDGYDPENNPNFFNTVKQQLAQAIPDYHDVIMALEIEARRDYYGASLAGTSFYNFKIKNNSNISIPLQVVGNSFFLINSQEAEVNNERYTYETTIQGITDIQEFDIQYTKCNFSSALITIDISDGSPIIEYKISYNTANEKQIRDEFEALGMNIEQVAESYVLLSEFYDTNNDFQYAFPVRLYTIFGIMSTIDFEYGEFFASVADFEMEIYTAYSMPVTIKLVAQDNTHFVITHRGETTDITDTQYSWDLESPIIVQAEYDNLRVGATIVSLLTILAIALVIMAMIYIAYRKNYTER